jgi:hypothetical protein
VPVVPDTGPVEEQPVEASVPPATTLPASLTENFSTALEFLPENSFPPTVVALPVTAECELSPLAVKLLNVAPVKVPPLMIGLVSVLFVNV